MKSNRWSVYTISSINFLLGAGTFILLFSTGYFGFQNAAGNTNAGGLLGGFAISLGIGALIGILFLDAAFATFYAKKRAVAENTTIATLICLGSLLFLWFNFTIPAERYTNPDTKLMNVPIYTGVLLYGIWLFWIVRRLATRQLFTN